MASGLNLKLNKKSRPSPTQMETDEQREGNLVSHPGSISGFRNNHIEAVPLKQNALFCSLFLIHLLFSTMDFQRVWRKET
jgi:hypothetical protein